MVKATLAIGMLLGALASANAATAATAAATDFAFSANSTSLYGGSHGRNLRAQGGIGAIRASFTYAGRNAGNMAGSYGRVTQLAGCAKQTVWLNSPVGPLSEEVSMVFRGPMDINNIAVYDGTSGTFNRVSSYSRYGGQPENLTFMNNKNIDYSGQNRHGPQGFASADGLTSVSSPTKFGGWLREATTPDAIGAGPGLQTGAEINIMTGRPCQWGDCTGFHSSNDYHGWGGSRKVFVTEVKMPWGSRPNQPAIWMLNAQIMHSGQYGCNCRGMGGVGGCGELDIAEVIETNAARNKVTTHYYFYDGSVPVGYDNFANRPIDRTVTYVTVIDDRNGGLVKVLELDSFDFSQTQLSADVYAQLTGWAASPAPAPAPGSCTLQDGYDYIGNDIANMPSAKAEPCCDYCRSTSGCRAFTWSTYNGGTCWLKSAKGSFNTGVAGVTSATI